MKFAALALVLLAPLASAQQVYKWTDDKGVVHYGSSLPSAAEQSRAKVGPVDTGIQADTGAPSTDPDYMNRQLHDMRVLNADIDARRDARRAEEAAEARAKILASARRAEERRQRMMAAAAATPAIPTGRFDQNGNFYAPGAGGELIGSDGRVLTPAGPNGYIDTRTGQYIPAN